MNADEHRSESPSVAAAQPATEPRIVLVLDDGGYDALYVDGKLVCHDHNLYAIDALLAIGKHFGLPFEKLETVMPEDQDFPPTLAEARAYEIKDTSAPTPL